MWVARDKDNKLVLYEFEPTRHYDKWYDYDNGTMYGLIELDESLFPNLKWEDEPIEVGLHELNPVHKVTCKKCGKEIKYTRSDILTGCDYQPGSGYSEEYEYLICPHCKGYIELFSNFITC